jgi:hypothetical protein
MPKLVCFLAALERIRLVPFAFPLSNLPLSSGTLSGLLNPAVRPNPAAARKHTGSRPLFPVLDVELRQIEIRQQSWRYVENLHRK